MENICIISASRTAMGAYGGALASIPATALGAAAVKDAIQKSGISEQDIESIVMGNVLSANLGQAPARQVSKAAGLPDNVCATTVNKVCASGMKAISMLANEIALGDIQVGIAGGMENMSQVPFYVPNARFGLGYGNKSLIDGLAHDGLTDVYHQSSMGISADKTAEKYEISREEQDDFAELSFKRAAAAWADGHFQNEIAPVEIPQRKGDPLNFTEDEGYMRANFEKMRGLRPAFSKDGTATAANSSSMNDGASALVLASESYVKAHNIKPLARIVAYAEAEQDPLFFTTTPVLATQKVLKKAGLRKEDIDCFEVNEAFAVVALAYAKMMDVPVDKINLNGGAVAIGHPLGSSGSRIVVTLTHLLHRLGGKYGLAAICNGGGGASALIIEKL